MINMKIRKIWRRIGSLLSHKFSSFTKSEHISDKRYVDVKTNKDKTYQEVTCITNGEKQRVKIINGRVVEKEGKIGNPFTFVRTHIEEKELQNKEAAKTWDE